MANIWHAPPVKPSLIQRIACVFFRMQDTLYKLTSFITKCSFWLDARKSCFWKEIIYLFITKTQQSYSVVWWQICNVRLALLARTICLPCVICKNLCALCLPFGAHTFQTRVLADIQMPNKSVTSQTLCKQEQKMGCQHHPGTHDWHLIISYLGIYR